MKGFLEEYGLIIVVVAVILLMLLFGKSGYAKSIQDAILGSANHIVETGENIVPKPAKASDTIDIEGTKYIVLEERENNQALVMTADSIGSRKFQSKARSDGQNMSTYEGSEIDNYLENDWYNSLSSTMKVAIQSTSIKQVSYYDNYDYLATRRETGYNGQVYNTITRHVFLPSVDEITKVVDLHNEDKLMAFGCFFWTRDSCRSGANRAATPYNGYGGLYSDEVDHFVRNTRPAFVIDLSQVDYKVTGHKDYK